MRRNPAKYLQDILDCIIELESMTSGMSFEHYLSNFVVRRAAEREFIIIAEALLNLGRLTSELHTRVASVREIAGFRNIIVHDYGDVDDEYVWDAIHNKTPILKGEIERWAEDLGA